MKSAFLIVLALTLASGCTPAQQAEATQIENTVLADLAAGKTLEQIEADVSKLVAGQAGADVVVIVNDALTLLEDLGVIPQGALPQAKVMSTTLHTQIALRVKP
jgi:uncharacterized protein YcfL